MNPTDTITIIRQPSEKRADSSQKAVDDLLAQQEPKPDEFGLGSVIRAGLIGTGVKLIADSYERYNTVSEREKGILKHLKSEYEKAKGSLKDGFAKIKSTVDGIEVREYERNGRARQEDLKRLNNEIIKLEEISTHSGEELEKLKEAKAELEKLEPALKRDAIVQSRVDGTPSRTRNIPETSRRVVRQKTHELTEAAKKLKSIKGAANATDTAAKKLLTGAGNTLTNLGNSASGRLGTLAALGTGAYLYFSDNTLTTDPDFTITTNSDSSVTLTRVDTLDDVNFTAHSMIFSKNNNGSIQVSYGERMNYDNQAAATAAAEDSAKSQDPAPNITNLNGEVVTAAQILDQSIAVLGQENQAAPLQDLKGGNNSSGTNTSAPSASRATPVPRRENPYASRVEDNNAKAIFNNYFDPDEQYSQEAIKELLRQHSNGRLTDPEIENFSGLYYQAQDK
jgi:hypothetical protein